MHDKFRLANSRRQMARLLALSDERKRQLEADPTPFLEQANSELSKLRQLVRDIKNAATGMDELVAHVPDRLPPRYEPIEAREARRLAKVKKLIADYKGDL